MTLFIHLSTRFNSPTETHMEKRDDLLHQRSILHVNHHGIVDPDTVTPRKHRYRNKKNGKVTMNIINGENKEDVMYQQKHLINSFDVKQQHNIPRDLIINVDTRGQQQNSNWKSEEDVVMGNMDLPNADNIEDEESDYDELAKVMQKEHKILQGENRSTKDKPLQMRLSPYAEKSKLTNDKKEKSDRNMNDRSEDLEWLKNDILDSDGGKASHHTTNKTPVTQLTNISSWSYLVNDKYVRHCITGEVIGQVPRDIQHQELQDIQTPSSETSDIRRTSFQKVFDTRAWGHSWDTSYRDMNASGMGATLAWTQEAMATLHIVINHLKHTLNKNHISILDVPCGDMQWMSRFLMTRDDIDYTGMDIVPALIAHHRKTYKDRPWKFRAADVVQVGIQQKYDIIVSRMMLQHLYFKDIITVLKHFSTSASPFLLTTTFARHDINKELLLQDNPGRYRQLNLETPPISLAPPLCLIRDGPGVGIDGWSHFLGLWQLPVKQVADCHKVQPMKLKGTSQIVYSCIKWSLVNLMN